MDNNQKEVVIKEIKNYFKGWEFANVGTNVLRVFSHPYDFMVDINMVKNAIDGGYMEEYLNGLVKE